MHERVLHFFLASRAADGFGLNTFKYVEDAKTVLIIRQHSRPWFERLDGR